MPGCSFSKAGISWDRTSPSRPIAQILRVVLFPADAEEQPMARVIRVKPEMARTREWRVICSLIFEIFSLTGGWHAPDLSESCRAVRHRLCRMPRKYGA